MSFIYLMRRSEGIEIKPLGHPVNVTLSFADGLSPMPRCSVSTRTVVRAWWSRSDGFVVIRDVCEDAHALSHTVCRPRIMQVLYSDCDSYGLRCAPGQT